LAKIDKKPLSENKILKNANKVEYDLKWKNLKKREKEYFKKENKNLNIWTKNY
jgi:hypothetical protein